MNGVGEELEYRVLLGIGVLKLVKQQVIDRRIQPMTDLARRPVGKKTGESKGHIAEVHHPLSGAELCVSLMIKREKMIERSCMGHMSRDDSGASVRDDGLVSADQLVGKRGEIAHASGQNLCRDPAGKKSLPLLRNDQPDLLYRGLALAVVAQMDAGLVERPYRFRQRRRVKPSARSSNRVPRGSGSGLEDFVS